MASELMNERATPLAHGKFIHTGPCVVANCLNVDLLYHVLTIYEKITIKYLYATLYCIASYMIFTYWYSVIEFEYEIKNQNALHAIDFGALYRFKAPNKNN